MSDQQQDPCPQLSTDQALNAVTGGKLPPFPEGNPGSWEGTGNAYAWAMAVAEVWGEAAHVWLQNTISDAVRRADIRAFKGWSVVQLALADFARVAQDADCIN